MLAQHTQIKSKRTHRGIYEHSTGVCDGSLTGSRLCRWSSSSYRCPESTFCYSEMLVFVAEEERNNDVSVFDMRKEYLLGGRPSSASHSARMQLASQSSTSLTLLMHFANGKLKSSLQGVAPATRYKWPSSQKWVTRCSSSPCALSNANAHQSLDMVGCYVQGRESR